MTTRVSTSPTVGFLSQKSISLSQAFIRAVQTKQYGTFKLANALMDADFLKAFIQESKELLKKEKSDENLRTVLNGIGLIKEQLNTTSYELAALHIACWMELFQEDKAFEIISSCTWEDKTELKRVISRIVQDPLDPLYEDFLQIQKILQSSF